VVSSLAAEYALRAARQRIFKKPLRVAWNGLRLRSPRLRTGAPFFLLKDGLTDRQQINNCVHAGPFFMEGI
jgi:hypothetical protein